MERNVLTLVLWFNQVQHLAEQILEGQGFDAHPLHPLTLFLVEILQLVHGQDAIAVGVHAAEPVLDAGERKHKHKESVWDESAFLDWLLPLLPGICVAPGWVLLVFFRYEEPDELGVAHPAFSLHGVAPGNQR